MTLRLKFLLLKPFATVFDPMDTVTIALVDVCHSSPWPSLRFTRCTCFISMGGHGCHRALVNAPFVSSPREAIRSGPAPGFYNIDSLPS